MLVGAAGAVVLDTVVVDASSLLVSVMSVVFGSPQYTPGNGYGHLGSLEITLVRTTVLPDCCGLDELGGTFDCGADEGLTDGGAEVDCMNDEGFAVLVRVLVIWLVTVDSLTTVVVGIALSTLAVTVMWIVDVCASGLERRPGSNMIESNMLGSTMAFCMLDNVTADIVVVK